MITLEQNEQKTETSIKQTMALANNLWQENLLQSARSLQVMASVIAADNELQLALEAGDRSALSAAIDGYWWQLHLETGLRYAAVYSLSDTALTHWGNLKWVRQQGTVDTLEPQYKILLDSIRQTEYPEWVLHCTTECVLHAGIPLIYGAQGDAGAIVFSVGLEEIVSNYYASSSTEVVLLDGREASKSFISPLLSTQPKLNQPWLAGLMQKVSLDDLVVAAITLQVGNQIRAVQAFDNSWHQDSHEILLLMSDITEQARLDRENSQRSILFAGLSWLLALLLLTALLWSPMVRLRQSAVLLPALAENRFQSLRGLLEQNRSRSWFRDEGDLINNTIIETSQRLEDLQGLLRNRANELEERGLDLETERDFVNSLLDTAHAIILTLDQTGHIQMINKHGLWITGCNEANLLDKPFSVLLAYSEALPDFRFHLQDLLSGKRSSLQHENEFVTASGSSIFIAWYHASLPQRGNGSHQVLSVGLDISERKRAEEHLGWVASHDELTGLFNRRRFSEEIEYVMDNCRRYKHQCALLYLDLDQFKDVNDSSGHHVGDLLLQKVSQILTQTARKSDKLARLGGDEFAILVQEADLTEAAEAAQRFCMALAKVAVMGKERVHRVSASIGVAIFPGHGEDLEELMANADFAMYQAKAAGRKRWCIYEESEMGRKRIQERVFWNEKVKQALQDEQFHLYFQPISAINDMQVSHYEALLRVPDEGGRVLPPSKLIESAERSGLIQELDVKIVNHAFAYVADLKSQNIAVDLAINLSGLSFCHLSLVDSVKKALDRYDTDPSSIIFEITETAAVSDIGSTNNVMQQLKRLGLRFALDDFGVGFSSLYYLKQLPIDYVKIDGSFIRNLKFEPDDQVLVKALVEVARAFGQMTIAEFVEDEETLLLLHALGVDYAQGYFIDKPKSFEQVWPRARALYRH